MTRMPPSPAIGSTSQPNSQPRISASVPWGKIGTPLDRLNIIAAPSTTLRRASSAGYTVTGGIFRGRTELTEVSGYRNRCHTELTEVSRTGTKVVQKLPKCRVLVSEPHLSVRQGNILRPYRTLPNTSVGHPHRTLPNTSVEYFASNCLPTTLVRTLYRAHPCSFYPTLLARSLTS